jgi:hypothetical protein
MFFTFDFVPTSPHPSPPGARSLPFSLAEGELAIPSPLALNCSDGCCNRSRLHKKFLKKTRTRRRRGGGSAERAWETELFEVFLLCSWNQLRGGRKKQTRRQTEPGATRERRDAEKNNPLQLLAFCWQGKSRTRKEELGVCVLVKSGWR